MPRGVQKTEIAEKTPSQSYITFPRGLSLNHILVVLLIAAAFLVGALYTKVQYLEKTPNTSQVAGVQTQPPSGAPNQLLPSAPPTNVKVDPGHFPVKGDPNAKVTLIEFADFRCPFCEQFFTTTLPQIVKNYVDTGKVKIYFRHYAFLGPASTVAANAAECANDQGKFWDMHDYLYQNQPPETDTSMYTVDNLTNIAGQLGMDTAAFNSCLSANKDSKNVSSDMADGQKAGVTATPTFYINGTQIVGAVPYATFQTAIESALKKS